jgi:serine/threonine protein kinase
MHAIENRVNGDGAAGRNSGGKGTIGGVGAAATGSARLQRYVDPTSADMSESELLSTHLMEQLTDIPSELSPESRVRQLQQLEQLQQQQQQQRSKATKGRNATAVTAAAEASVTAAAVTGGVTTKAAAPRVPADSAREDIAEEEVDDDGEEEEDGEGEPSITTAKVAVAHRPTQSLAPEEEDDDDDGTAYDGVRAQVLFKPVNRTAYHEVLASTWKPEGLTLRVPLETNTAKKEPANSSSSGSSNSGSGSDGEKEDVEEEAVQHRHGDNDDDDDAMASVVTRNKALKASEAQSMRAMKVYRVPAFPYGGGVTEQQARLLQRQFDACIQSGEHLHSNAAGPKLITKADFDSYQYSEVDVKTAQLDVASFQPTSPYEFVVEVEREVRFDAVKAREERRRRFKRLVHENRAPATMGTFDLRVIMDPFKTGFEEEKNFPIIAGTVIAGRYEIIQMLGKATFSRAVRCYDLHDPIYVDIEEEDDGEDGADDDADDVDGDNADENGASASPAENTATDKEVSGHGNSQHGEVAEAAGAASDAKKGSKKKSAKKRKLIGYGQVCLKIINNTKDFFDQALDEIRLLTLLNRQRDPDEAHIVRLIDAFYYKEHVMLVTELLRDTLYDYGKYNREEEEEFYFTVPRLRRLTRQIVEALTYVHSLNLIHTDLKPENIMFVSYSRCIVKVIDFGSSCFLSDHLSSYIQSRSYRAPEVVLGCDYDGRIDVWSLGAILVEMVTGDVLFTSDTVPEMLARIVYVCGTPFPRHMLWEGRHTSDYINKFGCIYEYGGAADDQRGANTSRGDDDGEEPYCLYTPVPTMAPHTCNAPKKAKPASTTSRTPAGPYSVLREKLAAANMVDKDFISFVEACLTLDHKKRPTTAQLLDHPFIKNEPL